MIFFDITLLLMAAAVIFFDSRKINALIKENAGIKLLWADDQSLIRTKNEFIHRMDARILGLVSENETLHKEKKGLQTDVSNLQFSFKRASDIVEDCRNTFKRNFVKDDYP